MGWGERPCGPPCRTRRPRTSLVFQRHAEMLDIRLESPALLGRIEAILFEAALVLSITAARFAFNQAREVETPVDLVHHFERPGDGVAVLDMHDVRAVRQGPARLDHPYSPVTKIGASMGSSRMPAVSPPPRPCGPGWTETAARPTAPRPVPRGTGWPRGCRIAAAPAAARSRRRRRSRAASSAAARNPAARRHPSRGPAG